MRNKSYELWSFIGPKYSWRAKSDCIFHSATAYGIASLHGESIKITEVPEVQR